MSDHPSADKLCTLRCRHSSMTETAQEQVYEPAFNYHDEDYKITCAEYINSTHLSQLMQHMARSAEEYARYLWRSGWQVVQFNRLPHWLRDNDLLLRGHRPQLYTIWNCFNSIFRVHTETGNIWTHLLGFGGFVAIFLAILTQPSELFQWQEKAVCSAFFLGAILCLGFSCLFHTAICHSEKMAKILSKMDYCGIALLIMGSFIPYLYYGFYCLMWAKIFYTVLIVILGSASIVVSMFDKFAHPEYRPLRAIVFIALGLSGVIPGLHVLFINGLWASVEHFSLGWLILMAVLYIGGASLYAARIPERIYPGTFDIWFQSHQIFHVCVVVAALVHYHGIMNLANYRLTIGDCKPSSNSHNIPYTYDTFKNFIPEHLYTAAQLSND